MLFSGKRHAITLIRVIKSVFPSSKVKEKGRFGVRLRQNYSFLIFDKARRLRKE